MAHRSAEAARLADCSAGVRMRQPKVFVDAEPKEAADGSLCGCVFWLLEEEVFGFADFERGAVFQKKLERPDRMVFLKNCADSLLPTAWKSAFEQQRFSVRGLENGLLLVEFTPRPGVEPGYCRLPPLTRPQTPAAQTAFVDLVLREIAECQTLHEAAETAAAGVKKARK
ncbi:hypothetical protein M3Y99_00213200 [Aphelenchoides fujianensis]|nr:hypothetical protein M3Y99_00213200 [Aphelenchoides fujianensis]